MNIKTTLVLLFLVVAGGVVWLTSAPPSWLPGWMGVAPMTPTETPRTVRLIPGEWTIKDLRRVEIDAGATPIRLRRASDGSWSLAGGWPTREPEVARLVESIAHWRSRFEPMEVDGDKIASFPLLASSIMGLLAAPRQEGGLLATPVLLTARAELRPYGLDWPPAIVTVQIGDQTQRVELAEPPDERNHFSLPTYARLEGQNEVIRLTPGLIAQLQRPIDYYRQRRLFPSERVATVDNASEKIDQLNARRLHLRDGETAITLVREGDDWRIQAPVEDLPDPDTLQRILTTLPDIWAEYFVDDPNPDLKHYGLAEPEKTLTWTLPSGETMTLLIGKPSPRRVERTISRPAPPFGPPMPPQMETVVERFRYAKLRDDEAEPRRGGAQIFEVRDEGLADVFVALDRLRDARLARFRADDATRLEVTYDGQTIVLAKEEKRWRLQKPVAADADRPKVEALLNEIARAQATKDNIFDDDAKEYGLDEPAGSVTVTVVEETGEGNEKTKKTKTFTLHLGKYDADKKKLYARVAGRPRVNALDGDELLQLTRRPALAYRGRRILDFKADDLAGLLIQRGEEQYQLRRNANDWRLTEPVSSAADARKVNDLAAELGRLEVVEFVHDQPTPDDLAQYGLDKPRLSVSLSFSDDKQPTRTLLLGKQRDNQTEYFAKLTDLPVVFVIPKDIHDDLDRGALAYLPLRQWQVAPQTITELRIEKRGEPAYRLSRVANDWRLTGPFEAHDLRVSTLADLLDDLEQLSCQRYVALRAKDLTEYGLDQPYLKLTLLSQAKPTPDAAEPTTAEQVLLIGNPAGAEGERFAKRGDNDAIFILGKSELSALDHDALYWLDRNLLSVNRRAITRIEKTGDHPWTLKRQGDEWQVEATAPSFTPGAEPLDDLLEVWTNLRAEGFAAYGPEVKWADYGLDKPFAKLTVTLQATADDDKPITRRLAIGKEFQPGQRYARANDGPGVAILSSAETQQLTQSYLDLMDTQLLRLDPDQVVELTRVMDGQPLALRVQAGGVWSILQPEKFAADPRMLDLLVPRLAQLRAMRIAAYPVKDLAEFGLDEPAAVWTLLIKDNDKQKQQQVKVGKETNDPTPGRYVLVEGTQVVGVIDTDLADSLLAPPLRFRDRALASFIDADRIELERGPRRVTFTKTAGTWKLTEPVEAKAEHAALEDFINSLTRLQADELIADLPKPTEENLRPFGLDRPQAQWRIYDGDREVLDLRIGSPLQAKDEQPRHHARLGAGGLIFLLDPRLSQRVVAEYRDRTLWTSLDPVQITILTYRDRRQDREFTLLNRDGQWEVIGKPDLKVNAAAVTDTLAAVADLKAERTVVDGNANLKLYGLEPPQLIIEAATSSGRRVVLHVGRQEGDSPRYYAQTPERSDVFLLSAKDAALLVRDLKALTEE
ncbi:MAG: DUF4340 domain-containing protein [Gemmataceae bacterium]